MRRSQLLTLAVAVFSLAAAAHADPCNAIPDRGPMPAYLHRGASFSGPVTYVGDGDSLCVAVGRGPANWVEVRLADFYAPELHEPKGPAAKAALEKIAKGKAAVCVADHRSYDRMVARCEVRGIDIGDALRAAGAVEGGRGRR
jgi:endonuclease YncB( thermonuclease family)